MDAPKPQQFRSKKIDVHGWLILDKPSGMTSTHALAKVKRAFGAKKAGHAGTLDPLATGCLPIAFGEATKTVPFAMDGRKVYRFTVRWGVETATDDSEGPVTATSDRRPDRQEILALLPDFTGTIEQVPPSFSAIKVAGERAYDLARDGEELDLASRAIEIHSLVLVADDADSATFEAETGKGAYVRALARDMGRRLGCHGHITALRRVSVGPFGEHTLISLDEIDRLRLCAPDEGNLADHLLPVETALDDIPALAVNGADAARLRRGQAILLRGRDAPLLHGTCYVTAQGVLVALAEAEGGEIHPKRVFQLPG
ncbi:tRNA pseudouridine(55) synthase TruB [Terrihabitans sp. B22-R8]|uniref:tRNA pseudouridine(55) synthase TruB n=1 Tax=Terrihabitans sp. B22-R8 TaxID=3425128 RepID=UPI00403D2A44